MLIYTKRITPRLRYVLKFIFRDVFQVEYRLTDDFEVFRKMDAAKINYSSLETREGFRLPVSGLIDSVVLRTLILV
jgi:hypothetical protein